MNHAPAGFAALLLSVSLLLPGMARGGDDDAQVTTDTEKSVAKSLVSAGDGSRFARVFEKAARGEAITVGFLGGSITQGYAAKDPPHRYADRVTEWFHQQFPKSKVTEVNAGIGGTGSDYGALRLQRDLLPEKPDVVVVEFAVNDEDKEHAARTLEGVVRQVLSAPNQPACLLLFMSHDGRNAQAWHSKIGQHYNLPMVSYRDGLADEIKAGRLKWTDISPDDIHPNTRGHGMAARYVTTLLEQIKATSKPADAAPLPSPLLTDLYANVDSRDAIDLTPTKNDGWALDPATKSWRSDRVGSAIEFAIDGRGAAVGYYRIHKDMGRVKVAVDGKHEQTLDGWFSQTWGGYRHTADLVTDLPAGPHTVRFELIEDKAPQSNGHEFRLMGLAGLGTAAKAGGSATASPAAAPYVWKNVPIVGGGYITGIIPHPTEPGLMYAKTDIGGAYRRDSAKGPWIPITDWIGQTNWTYAGIESLAVDPSDPNRVYIAGGAYTNSWSGPGAILRSNDRGKTWAVTPMPFKMGGNENGRGQGERLAVDPNDGRVLFFGSRKNGLWKSRDRGETWAAVENYPLPDDTKGIGTVFVLFDPASGSKGTASTTLIAGINSPTTPLLRSIDGGATWTPMLGVPKGLVPHHATWGEAGTLYVTFGNGPGPNDVTDGAFYRWETKQDAWTNISPVKPGADDKFGYSGVTVDARDPRTVAVSTLDRWAKTDDIFRSRDGGQTWTSLGKTAQRDHSAAPWLTFGKDKAPIGHWLSDIEIDPADPNHLLYVTGWGMWESFDINAADAGQPTHWTVAATGIDEGVMNEVLSPPSGASVLSVMWDLDGFRHTDVDASPAAGFFKPQYARNTSIDFAETDPNFVVRVYGGQEMGGTESSRTGGSFSTDNAVSWTAFPTSPSAGSADGYVAMSADGGAIVWAPEWKTPAVTRDRGKTWALAVGLPWNLRVIADRADVKRFYAFDGATGVVYASQDGGVTFTAGAKNLPVGDGFCRARPGAACDVLLCTGTGLLRSLDGGQSFTALPGVSRAWRVGFGASPTAASAAAIYLAGEVGGQYGFYRSDDDGRSWTRINDDQHQFMEITSISGDPRVPGRIYVASRSRGLLRGDPVR